MDLQINEALDILQEECAEVIQIRSKIRRSGLDYIPYSNPQLTPYIPGELSNHEKIKLEIFDVLTLLDFLKDKGFYTEKEYQTYKPIKQAKLKKWSNIYSDFPKP